MLDDLDSEILGALRENARISYRDLGDRVGLSANAAADRVRRLVERRIITSFTAVVSPTAAGRNLTALIDVQIVRGTDPAVFEEAVGKIEQVLEATHVTGRFDYHLRVACVDTDELDSVIRRMKREAFVVLTDTRIVLRTAFARALS